MFTSKRIDHLKLKVQDSVDCEIYNSFNRRVTMAYKEEFNCCKINQQKKYEHLIREKYGDFLNEVKHKDVDKWLVNLTNVIVPQEIKYILSLGPKFNLANNSVPYVSVFIDAEFGLRQVVDSEKTSVRNDIANILRNHKILKGNHKSKDFKEKFILKLVEDTKHFLRGQYNGVDF